VGNLPLVVVAHHVVAFRRCRRGARFRFGLGQARFALAEFLRFGVEVRALSVEPREVVVVCGPSGSGKSTLIRCINGLETIRDGDLVVDGQRLGDPATNMTRLRTEIGFVFQSFNLYPHKTALDNVTLAPIHVRKIPRAEAEQAGRELLAKVGLADKVDAYPAQLSGGQQQRVAVARALAGSPSILLADEPTGNLDSQNANAVMELLRELHQDGATICMVTHDPRFAQHAERGIHLLDGRVVNERQAASSIAD